VNDKPQMLMRSETDQIDSVLISRLKMPGANRYLGTPYRIGQLVWCRDASSGWFRRRLKCPLAKNMWTL